MEMLNNQLDHVNLSYLDEISGGDSNFQKELIKIFLSQIPDFVINIKKYFTNQEIENLAKEAHTAKSSVLIFMMSETGKNLKQIQSLAENNQLEQIPLLMTEVEKSLEAAFKELTGYLDELELSEVKPDNMVNW
jgi:HPt (histidine-containing phosphotransfer) domain-containing protein